ncbi:MAG: hypothetical protein COV35_09780 [Alphaproteobacteria bacterium CG11_big_fil_rev_8_21_14_0_20_39_49]|nr:MAG: hypothetical protein COV35_09780 [Alphaproteobacteria bacterium CG11_big_fil_rev_8_21_14_0_20_39_49]
MKKNFLSPLFGFVVFAYSSVAFAQVVDKEYKDWTVYTTNLQGKVACYMASFPISKTGNYTKRGDPYLLVTRLNDDVFEVSASSGYKYKLNSDVAVDIEGNKFEMFTKGELAWAKDSKQDKEIIGLMIKKNHLDIRGTSIKGTYSIDRYSLSGFTAAYNRMKKRCEGN